MGWIKICPNNSSYSKILFLSNEKNIRTSLERSDFKTRKRFGGGLDLQAVLFLIGLQELGLGYQKLKKDQKLT